MKARNGRGRLLVALLVVASVTSVVTATGSHAKAQGATRPNIVVIEVDDMRMSELPYMTQTLAALPGTNFTHSYVSTSLCCPSRAAFLSGQYTQNNKVVDNGSYGKFDHTNTLASWLHSAGYFTGIVGKYLNGYGCSTKTPPGWDHWQALCASVYGMYAYSLKDNGTTVKYTSLNKQYQTDMISSRSVATVDEAAASGKPFFLYITPTAPHSGRGTRVAPKYKYALPGYQLPKTPAYNEADVSDKPDWVQHKKLLTAAQTNRIQAVEKVRLQMLLSVDDLVTNVVNELRATGQIDNTEIIFTSDNGFMLGEHRLPTGKEVEYEDSLAVPLLISGPGIPVGTNDNLVMNTDLAPTIADMAGVTPGRVEDGRSLLPLLFDGQSWPRRAIRHFVTSDANAEAAVTDHTVHPAENGLRAWRYTYFELATGERELYDHVADPYELVNLAGQPRYAALQAQLAFVLARLKTCAGASCQFDLPDIIPTATATSNCTDLTCTFDASRSDDVDGNIVSYDWDFGDGTTGSGITATHDYQAAGTYHVTLKVTDDDGATNTDSLTVTGTAANVLPTANITSSCTDEDCHFDGTGSTDLDGTVVSYNWNFGDAKTSTLPTPSHDYTKAGNFTVSLTVTDDRGGQATATKNITVTAANILPVARFSKSCSSLHCDFDGSISSDTDGNIVSYAWDFGDGVVATGQTPSHDYQFSGVYDVSLIVTDDRGGTGTTDILVTV